MDSGARRRHGQASTSRPSLGLHRTHCPVPARRVSALLCVFSPVVLTNEGKIVAMEPLCLRVCSRCPTRLAARCSPVPPGQNPLMKPTSRVGTGAEGKSLRPPNSESTVSRYWTHRRGLWSTLGKYCYSCVYPVPSHCIGIISLL